MVGRAWEVSDTSEQQQNLIGLLPGSQYNVSVVAVNSHGASAPKSALLWTKIGGYTHDFYIFSISLRSH